MKNMSCNMKIANDELDKINTTDFSADLFEGICSYTDQELEAHSRVLNNLSVDSRVNILHDILM